MERTQRVVTLLSTVLPSTATCVLLSFSLARAPTLPLWTTTASLSWTTSSRIDLYMSPSTAEPHLKLIYGEPTQTTTLVWAPTQ